MSRPLIGITCDYDIEKENSCLHRGYYKAVIESGGLPLLIANIPKERAAELLGSLDGIIFSGGQDVDPVHFGEDPHLKMGQINPVRDELELSLCKHAMERDLPLLGICRGAQLLNIAMGGTIYQDLESQWGDGALMKHSQTAPSWHATHQVEILEDSKLSGIFKGKTIRTNSFHHQAIKEPASCFEVVARCKDGVIEGIESRFHSFVLGVQWHPEKMWERDKKMLGLFKELIKVSSAN